MKRIITMLFALLISIGLLAGCGTENASKGATQEVHTITDIGGTQVQLPTHVERIADLWPANNQVMLMLGGADKLVATTQYVQTLPWFSHIYPNIKNIAAPDRFGFDLQLEELQKVSPQVIIVNSKKQAEQVRQGGFTAVHMEFTDYKGLRNVVSMTADILGGNAVEIAKSYNAYLDKNIALAEEKTKGLTDAERPRVMHIATGENLLKVDGTKTIIDEWIHHAGGINAIEQKGRGLTLTMEEIIKANPDIIIIGDMNSKAAIEKIMNDPQWSSIKAVQMGRVYSNPVGTFKWDRYSAESALQILWAGQIIQPQLFGDINLVKETQDFYKHFMHYELSTTEAERIIAGEGPQ
ncbi:ABC transporter substrate-binding protein [Veillonella sp. CHU732]|uniref:ABC transporter substrate-binding protein n=1 Tax=Veillonella sp. CHU732 TaxID=2490949 RepID=UPI000F8C372D|nr:ABC transporter substrate-binding protein [Veillonella sp. CHU732]